MTTPCTDCPPDFFGADPYTPKWQIVRGDSAQLRIEFFNDDETTPFDTSTWDYTSSVYDTKGKTLHLLDVEPGNGYATLIVTPELSATWGTGYKGVSTELVFDLQVTIGTDIWTPVIGTITVLSDVTGVNL
jgi:hypothetical protein